MTEKIKKNRGTQLVDLTGQTFGRWTVLNRSPQKTKRPYWTCKCECGSIKDVRGDQLRRGVSTSCGCFAKDFQRERISREGWSKTAWKPTTGACRYMVEKDGEKHTLEEWSKITGISLPVLIRRWNRGWSDAEILEPTPNQMKKQFETPDPIFDPKIKVEDQEVRI